MVPDERRGKLRLCKDTDGLTHLQWGVRAPDMPFTPEEDLLVFPREAEMKFIPKPGVFVIKFPDDPSRDTALDAGGDGGGLGGGEHVTFVVVPGDGYVMYTQTGR